MADIVFIVVAPLDVAASEAIVVCSILVGALQVLLHFELVLIGFLTWHDD